jgi:hypothetical protein
MRKKIISPYPTISSQAPGENGNLDFAAVITSYHNDAGQFELEDGSLICNDRPWIAQDDPLSISVEIQLSQELWNAIEGALPNGATAGIALSWQSKGSLKRGLSTQIPLATENVDKYVKLELKFNRAEIRDTLSYEFIIFLLTPAECLHPDEAHKCNIPGTILGTPGETYTIRADGRGSAFPIFPIAGDATGALWSLDCNWSDCMEDPFDGDSIRININTNHRDCPEEWTSEEKKPLSPLTKSIICDAIATLILSVQREGDTWDIIKRTDSLTNAEFEPTSIAHALWHFYNTYDMNDETPAALMKSCGKIRL